MESVALRLYPEKEVSDVFQVSSARLRTAQKVGLIQSRMGRRGRSWVRVWSIDQIALAVLASEIDDMLCVPYSVACQIILTFRPQEVMAVRNFRQFDSLLIPTIRLFDRLSISIESEIGHIVIGELMKGDDNRFYMQPVDPVEPSPGPFRGLSEVSCANIFARFIETHKSHLSENDS